VHGTVEGPTKYDVAETLQVFNVHFP